MKKYFLQFLMATAALVLVACSKSDEKGRYIVGAKLNGSKIRTNDFGMSYIGYVNEFTTLNQSGDGFVFFFSKDLVPGSYELENSEISLAYLEDTEHQLFLSDNILESYYYPIRKGEIIIEEIKLNDDDEPFMFKAIFSGEAIQSVAPFDTIQVTEGWVDYSEI